MDPEDPKEGTPSNVIRSGVSGQIFTKPGTGKSLFTVDSASQRAKANSSRTTESALRQQSFRKGSLLPRLMSCRKDYSPMRSGFI
jgi:hypothetical protein